MEIRVISAHGDYSIQKPSDSISVADLCVLNRIPVNSVAVYGRKEGSANVEPMADTLKSISELRTIYAELIIRPDRNISYESALPSAIQSDIARDDVASYFFRAPGMTDGGKGSLIQ
jgi:hypothetical protein